MFTGFVRQGCSTATAAFFFTLMLAGVSTAIAQTSGTGALVGTVSDSSGAVVRDVKITATSADTGQVRTATTAVDGTYNINLLPPGNYRVKFEASGFKTIEIPSATVNVTETAVLDRTLEVGSANQSVTVEEAVEPIQTTNSTMGSVADSRTVTELPLNTRNYTNLLTMAAGANSSVSNASTIGKGSPFIAVNGAGNSQNTYLQDGVVVNNWYSFNTGVEGVAFGSFVIPIPDAIAEFKIQTSSYDAGYGRGPGASVNVVTKSGTNSFHGSGFEFFRNTDMNGNDWFRNFEGLPRGALSSNQYGGVVGGPIKKDKLFFFASYQETGQKNGLSGYGLTNVTLPPIPGGDRGSCPTGWTSLSQCNAAGQAFVPALASAICPANHPTATGDATSIAGGLNVACPGSGSGDALFNMSPIAISMLQLKLPNGSYAIPGSGLSPSGPGGGYGLQSFSDPAIFRDHNLMGNGDYVINSANTLALRYQYERDPLQAPFPVLNANLAGSYLPGNPVVTTKWNHAGMVKLTTILSPNLVNEAHVAYQFNGVIDTTQTPFTDTQVGVTPFDARLPVLSDFTIGSGQAGFSFGAQYQFDGIFHDQQIGWGDQVSWTHGKHTVRAGVDVENIRFATYYPGHAIGAPTFTRFSDFLIGRGSCQVFTGTGTCSATNPGNTNGSAAASDINNDGTFIAEGALDNHWLFHALELSAFVQDDFKVTPRLTVNLGVRWEYNGYPTDANGGFSGVYQSLFSNTAPPQCPALNGVTCTTNAGTLAGYGVPANYGATVPAGVTVLGNNGPAMNGAPFTDFAPRGGFAWQPTGSSKWVVRGGAGMFYDLIAGIAFLSNMTLTPPYAAQPVASGLSGASLQNPWPSAPAISTGNGAYGFVPLWVNPGNLTTTPVSSNLQVDSQQPNITVPVTYQWNMNTQWEFRPSWLLEVAYIGSHGIHQGSESQAAQQGQIANIVGTNIAPLVGQGCTSCSIYGVTTNTVANVALRVPELGISAQNPVLATEENYKFNGLEVTVRKQMSHGLQLEGAYTLSRSFISVPFGINEYPYLVHAYQPNNNYRPERFILSYLWNIPTGQARGALQRVIGDWALSGVTTIQDGQYMTITDTGGSIFLGGSGAISTANMCPGFTYAQVLASGSMDARVTSGLLGGNGYFTGNSSLAGSALCPTPTIGNGKGFGNMGGGAVLGPGQFNFDASLSKLIRIREKQALQFRSEFFNILNHPQFALPGLGANQSTFGQITSMSVSPRVIQLALKYQF
jgi:hypothetical protein